VKRQSILTVVNDWFTPRKGIILGVGALFIFISALYIAVLPSLTHSTLLQQRSEALQSDLQWLSEQGETVSRLTNSCFSKSIGQESAKTVINRLVRRNQIKLITLSEQNKGTYLINLESTNANSLLQLAHQLACQGLKINILNASRPAAEEESYAASMEVERVE
jgi:type II secretory pathway component PulM